MLGRTEAVGEGDSKGQDGITDSMDMSVNKLRSMGKTGKPGVLQSMRSQRVRFD